MARETNLRMTREEILIVVRRSLHHVDLGCSRYRIRQFLAIDELPAVDQDHHISVKAPSLI
jgi:hypothetical protein